MTNALAVCDTPGLTNPAQEAGMKIILAVALATIASFVYAHTAEAHGSYLVAVLICFDSHC